MMMLLLLVMMLKRSAKDFWVIKKLIVFHIRFSRNLHLFNGIIFSYI